MNLFIDIDETILKALIRSRGRLNPPVLGGRVPDRILKFGNDRYDLYLRPDIEVLRGIPFCIFTSGAPAYADAVRNLLGDRGFRVRDVFHRGDMLLQDDRNVREITSSNSFLIDDMPSDSGVVQGKLGRLPNGVHFRTHAWTATIHPTPAEMRGGMSFKEFLKRRRYVLTFRKDYDTMSLRRAVETIRRIAS